MVKKSLFIGAGTDTYCSLAGKAKPHFCRAFNVGLPLFCPCRPVVTERALYKKDSIRDAGAIIRRKHPISSVRKILAKALGC